MQARTRRTRAKKVRYDQVCKHCGYKWKSIKEHPKECPQCKRYLNWGGLGKT